MKYSSGADFLNDPNKNILLMGLSGVGKTTICRALPADEWFHYSVDYRIWTHQLGDELNDFIKTLALSNPILKDLLKHDAITVEHRVHFDNLYATSLYMGMLGKPSLGGSTEKAFRARMAHYAAAEQSAMLDIPYFVKRSHTLYNYPHFLVDASGSLCEIVDLDDPDDNVIKLLEQNCTVIYIEATEQHKQELLRRHSAAPKPIYYRPDFLDKNIPDLLTNYNVDKITKLSPAEVCSFLYPRLLDHRITQYKRLANKIGYTISMTDILAIKDGPQLLQTIANKI